MTSSLYRQHRSEESWSELCFFCSRELSDHPFAVTDMSRQWSCATLGAGVVSVDHEFLENATPEALAAYEDDILRQMAVSLWQYAALVIVDLHASTQPRSCIHTTVATVPKELSGMSGGFKVKVEMPVLWLGVSFVCDACQRCCCY